jgi:hypothetical protein
VIFALQRRQVLGYDVVETKLIGCQTNVPQVVRGGCLLALNIP